MEIVLKLYHTCVYLPLIVRTRATVQKLARNQTTIIPFRLKLYSEMTDSLKNVTTEKALLIVLSHIYVLLSGHK